VNLKKVQDPVEASNYKAASRGNEAQSEIESRLKSEKESAVAESKKGKGKRW
jgi:hypothetical protein